MAERQIVVRLGTGKNRTTEYMPEGEFRKRFRAEQDKRVAVVVTDEAAEETSEESKKVKGKK